MIPRWLPVLCAGVALAATAGYRAEIEQWRRTREAGLKSPDGWLSLAGLFWLHEGANRFGTAPGNEIVLPDGLAHAGTFELHNGSVTVETGGAAHPVKPDSSDAAKVGRLSLFIIKRGDKFGVRVKDPQSQALREFHGVEYFPIDEAYRVKARFVSEPRKVPILNVLGQTEGADCPGYAEFNLNGRELRLYPIIESPGDKELFYVFHDQTSGKETYGAGRFLYSAMPHNGIVVIDFNKAYNPPCAFTPYATCPLPPRENRLPVRIEAGEKKYGNH